MLAHVIATSAITTIPPITIFLVVLITQVPAVPPSCIDAKARFRRYPTLVSTAPSQEMFPAGHRVGITTPKRKGSLPIIVIRFSKSEKQASIDIQTSRQDAGGTPCCDSTLRIDMMVSH